MPERAARLELRAGPLEADAEPLELLARLAGADPLERGGAGAGGDQVAVVTLAGAGHDLPGGPLTEPAAGRGDRAPERLRVGRVDDQRQVGERVAHLRALVQAERAEHPVRDPGGSQRASAPGRSHTRSAPARRISAGGVPSASSSATVRRDPGRLLPLGRTRAPAPVRRVRASRSASWAPGRGLWRSTGRPRTRISACERKLRAEHDPLVPGEPFGEPASPRRPPAERVEDLIIVADAAQIPVRAGEQARPARPAPWQVSWYSSTRIHGQRRR